MTSPCPRVRFRYHDFTATPDDMRYELIGGALILLPPPQRDPGSSGPTGMPLHLFAAPIEPGEVYFAPGNVRAL